MDSVISKSTPGSLPGTRATRMLPVEAGQGVHLIATCLLNAPTSQMSVAEIYEWLAQRYPEYQYTKYKIRKVLEHDSTRKCSRFVRVASTYQVAGAPLRWTIRPGTEPRLRQCFSGPPPTKRPIPQFYGGLSQVIHCVLCKVGFDGHESFVTHQQEAHSTGATMSPAVQKEMRSVDQAPAAIRKPGSGSESATGKAHCPDKLTDPGPAAEAEAKTEFATQGSGEMEEETLFVVEMPTAANGSGRRRAREGELDDRTNADKSATGDETRTDAQSFKDAASHQFSDDDDSSLDSIRAEKQENGRMHCFIHAMITVKTSPRGSRCRI